MDTQTIVAIVASITAITTAYLAYRKSLRVDAVAAQAAAASGVSGDTRAGTAQIIDGLNMLLTHAQSDNRELRTEARADAEREELLEEKNAALRAEARVLLERIITLIDEGEKCKTEVNRLHLMYGGNGKIKDNGE